MDLVNIVKTELNSKGAEKHGLNRSISSIPSQYQPQISQNVIGPATQLKLMNENVEKMKKECEEAEKRNLPIKSDALLKRNEYLWNNAIIPHDVKPTNYFLTQHRNEPDIPEAVQEKYTSKLVYPLSSTIPKRRPEDGDYPCSQCPKVFANTGNLNRHFKLTHAFCCKICKKVFSKKLVMESHYFEEHVEHCKVCKKSFANSGNLNRHIKLAHGNDFKKSNLPSKPPTSLTGVHSFDALGQSTLFKETPNSITGLHSFQIQNVNAILPNSARVKKQQFQIIPPAFTTLPAKVFAMQPKIQVAPATEDPLKTFLLNPSNIQIPHLQKPQNLNNNHLPTLNRGEQRYKGVSIAPVSQSMACTKPTFKPQVTAKQREEQIVDDFLIKKTANGGGICFKCIPCKGFSHFSSCRRHYITEHGAEGDKVLGCLVCPKRFALKAALSNHYKSVHKITGKIQYSSKFGGNMAIVETGGGLCLICCKHFSHLSSCCRHFHNMHKHLCESENIRVTNAPTTLKNINTHNSNNLSSVIEAIKIQKSYEPHMDQMYPQMLKGNYADLSGTLDNCFRQNKKSAKGDDEQLVVGKVEQELLSENSIKTEVPSNASKDTLEIKSEKYFKM